jgi:virginiamycin B lyase
MNQSLRVLLTTAALGLPALALAQHEGPAELADGDGKNLVQGICTACHETTLITGSTGYDKEGWRYLFGNMIALSDPIADQIATYLAEHYPATGQYKPTLVDGDTQIAFKEWHVPTLGQRPRDPLMAADGTIWWAGMFGSLVGMLDPRTGEMKEYRLDPTARPHSIIEGPNGDIWYSGNSNSTIGVIHRDTDEIQVYPLNNPEARDPHTMAFDENGILWFTVQNSNFYGSLDPATGEVYLARPPTERARPYGIRRDSNGMMWIAYRGAYKIARINPETREITEFETPNYGKHPGKGYNVRRLAIDEQDNVWYVDSALGEIGRYNQATGEFKQWKSPSGVDSHPYGIEVIDGIVWYNESDVRPDTLVRFDPETEEFQSWPFPSGIGIIRNMSKTPDGNLVVHQSSTNTVGLVLIGEENIAKYADILVSQN